MTKTKQTEHSSFNQLLAFQLIELTAYWEGKVNSSHLEKYFGISRSTASKLSKEYRHLNPDQIVYDEKAKCFKPTKQMLARKDLPLETYAHCCLSRENFEPELSHFATHGILIFHGLQRQPNPKVVQTIIHAIKNKQRIDFAYASLSNPDLEDRIISPHSLVYDGARWHVRAWCERGQGFRDFVLSRVKSIHNLEGPAEYGIEQDTLWNSHIEFTIEPDNRLSEEQQNIVALDFKLNKKENGWERTIRVRKALITYWLQHLRLNHHRENPEAQQIMLSTDSRKKLEPYLPK